MDQLNQYVRHLDMQDTIAALNMQNNEPTYHWAFEGFQLFSFLHI